jgi:hypothetical protein
VYALLHKFPLTNKERQELLPLTERDRILNPEGEKGLLWLYCEFLVSWDMYFTLVLWSRQQTLINSLCIVLVVQFKVYLTLFITLKRVLSGISKYAKSENHF